MNGTRLDDSSGFYPDIAVHIHDIYTKPIIDWSWLDISTLRQQLNVFHMHNKKYKDTWSLQTFPAIYLWIDADHNQWCIEWGI